MPWSTPLDTPIRLASGRRLTTLQEAADYIMKLPEADQQLERWQVAIAHLIKAAEIGGGWLTFAEIALLRALNEDDA